MNRWGVSALFAFLPLSACLADGTPLTAPPGQVNPLFPEVQSLLRMKKIPPAVSMYSPASYPAGYPAVGHAECADPGCTSCGERGWNLRRPKQHQCAECGEPATLETCGDCRAKRVSGRWQRFRDWLCFQPAAKSCCSGPTPYQPPLYTYFDCMPQRIPEAPPEPPKRVKARQECRDCSVSACGECKSCQQRRLSRLGMRKLRPGSRGCSQCGECCDTPALTACPHCGGNLSAVPTHAPVATSLKPPPGHETGMPVPQKPVLLSDIRPPAAPDTAFPGFQR